MIVLQQVASRLFNKFWHIMHKLYEEYIQCWQSAYHYNLKSSFLLINHKPLRKSMFEIFSWVKKLVQCRKALPYILSKSIEYFFVKRKPRLHSEQSRDVRSLRLIAMKWKTVGKKTASIFLNYGSYRTTHVYEWFYIYVFWAFYK